MEPGVVEAGTARQPGPRELAIELGDEVHGLGRCHGSHLGDGQAPLIGHDRDPDLPPCLEVRIRLGDADHGHRAVVAQSGRNARSASRRGSMSSSGWSCIALVERQTADDAQARAVRPAERGDRLGQRDRLADRRLQVELVVVGQAQRVGLVVRVGSGRPVARSSDGRYSSSISTSTGDASGRGSGALAGERGVRRASTRIPRFVRASRTCPRSAPPGRGPRARSIRTSATS